MASLKFTYSCSLRELSYETRFFPTPSGNISSRRKILFSTFWWINFQKPNAAQLVKINNRKSYKWNGNNCRTRRTTSFHDDRGVIIGSNTIIGVSSFSGEGEGLKKKTLFTVRNEKPVNLLIHSIFLLFQSKPTTHAILRCIVNSYYSQKV